MKELNFIALFFLTTILVSETGLYDHSVPKIEGGSQNLSIYQGKKILVITLPIQQNASADSLLYSLDTLAIAHASDFKVIAVPAYEDGYVDTMKNQLLSWYRSKLGSYILITDGLYTRKTSGSQQHPVFKWLTHVSENGVFDVDVDAEEPGSKFFISASGKLNGVLKSKTKIWGRAVQKTLQLQ